MFSYVTVVYGLKQNQRLHESSEISELLSCRNNIIYEHHPKNNESCGWPGLHYHGLFEFITKLGFHNDRIINQIKMHCSHFTDNDCKHPLDYFTLVDKYEMKLVCTKICPPSHLFECKKLCDALKHVNTTSTRPIADENMPRPCYFNMSKNANCHTPILDLCKAFSSGSSSANSYLTPIDSATYVHTWCIAQNIATKDFINNWIYCLDCESKFKNTLYFQGNNNLCIKAILHSVMEACEPLVGKVSKGTTGYKYFWKCCLSKRMIALYEPYFDGLHFSDNMLEILEGTESHITIDNNSYVTMQRTPIVVIAREWQSSRKLQFEIKNRLVNCYNELKSFRPPEAKLHPTWLCLLAEKYNIPWSRKNENDNKSHASPNEVPNRQNIPNEEPNRRNTPNTGPSRQNIPNVEPNRRDTPNIPWSQKNDNESHASPNKEPNNITKCDNQNTKIINVFHNSDGISLNFPQPEIQPAVFTNEADTLMMEEYYRISNLGTPYSQQEECENTSDWNSSEISDFVDTVDKSENASVKSDFFGPKVVMDVPQIISSEAPDCEKFNEHMPGPNEVINHRQDARENEVEQQCEENASAMAGLVCQKKQTKKSRHKVRVTEKNTSVMRGSFQPELANLPSPGTNPPGPSSIKVNKKKESKKSSHVVQVTEENTSAMGGLFEPEFADLPSQEMNSPGPSNVTVKKKKETKSIQGKQKKRSADENLTAREKIRKVWKNGEMIHPCKQWNVTFNNL